MKFYKSVLVMLLSLTVNNIISAGQGVTTRLADIQDIDILILESFPVQVHVRITGTLNDSCTTVQQITQKRQETLFILEVTTARPADAMCAQVSATFNRSVALDVIGLMAGTYTVQVNNITDTFVLHIDNQLRTTPYENRSSGK